MVRGVIDSDYIGEIKVLISPPTKTVQINKGQRVTQLLLLPYYQTGKNLTSQARSHKAFGSSDLAFWVQEITAPRPLKDLLIQGNKMSGLSYEQLFRLVNIDSRYIVGLFPHIETANIPENKTTIFSLLSDLQKEIKHRDKNILWDILEPILACLALYMKEMLWQMH